MFYVETDNRLQWLHAVGLPDQALEGQLSLRDLLQAHGHVLEHHVPDPGKAHMAFARTMLADASLWSKALVTLEFTGADAIKSIGSKFGSLNQRQIKLLNMAQNHGLARQAENGQWICTNEDSNFLKGHWLEAAAADAVRRATRNLGVTEVLHGVRFYSLANPEVRNEVDVAWVQDNHLHLIECKAITSRKLANLSDFPYTLESVRQSGGLTARAALLTWGLSPGAGTEARARANRITLFNGAQLGQLDTALAAWGKSR